MIVIECTSIIIADLENGYQFLMGEVGVGLECSFSY